MSRDPRIEDLTFLADHGVGLTAAARRIGTSERNLDRWLRSRDVALRDRLRNNNPRDHNLTTVTTGRRSNRTADLNLQEI